MSTLPLKLLLVEESPALAREVQSLPGVEGSRAQLHRVETLGQAFAMLAHTRFNCVLLDLHLPDAEGLDGVERFRARDADTPLVVLTGPDDGELALQALRCGAQGHLLKHRLPRPELPADVLSLIDGAINRRRRAGMSAPAVSTVDDTDVRVFAPRDEDDCALAFQPWAELEGGAICGVEVLLAPRAAQGTPRDILRAAESQGELTALSHWVLCRVGAIWKTWRGRGLAPSRLSVNLASSELHSRHFARSRLALTAELGLAPTDLQIELAEDALLGAGVEALAELQALRDTGIRVVADNVGRSQAALLALGRLPLDGIKLDLSLMEAVRHHDRGARATVRGLVAMCAELGVPCCAVGVEIATDHAACRELGVHHVQGYWVARPQTATATEGWLARCMPTGQRTPDSGRPGQELHLSGAGRMAGARYRPRIRTVRTSP